MIKLHKLQRFVINLVVPPHYLTEDDHITDQVNPEYETWEVQDQTLLGSNHSYQVWDKIHEYKSCARQLRSAMRAVSLEKSIEEYTAVYIL